MEMYNNLITRNNYQKAVASEIIFYYANKVKMIKTTWALTYFRFRN